MKQDSCSSKPLCIACMNREMNLGRFLTTNEGAPYLAFFWPDVGINCSRTGNSQAQPALSHWQPLFPYLAKRTPDMGHPRFVLRKRPAHGWTTDTKT